MAARETVPAPELPESVSASELDAGVRRDLRGLQKETAEIVARHLVAAGVLVDDDPELALRHARYARLRASRIAVVREAAGIVAYHAGEWNEALGEFRAARRMGGGPGHVPVMADIERALGRPERALDLARSPEARDLGQDERVELLIVAAGARRDLGEVEAAVVGLQIPELDPARRDPWSARLFYAHADNLLAAGREADAVQWFVHAHDADTDRQTDAAQRIAELTGEELPGAADDGLTLGVEDLPAVDHDGTDRADEAGPGGSADEAEPVDRTDEDEPGGSLHEAEPTEGIGDADRNGEPDRSGEAPAAPRTPGETGDADGGPGDIDGSGPDGADTGAAGGAAATEPR